MQEQQQQEALSNQPNVVNGRCQELVHCRARIYKLSKMQRCPYIYEMKERLLGEQGSLEDTPQASTPEPTIVKMEGMYYKQPVATIVKLNSDGFSSHTTTNHQQPERTSWLLQDCDFRPVDKFRFPKNAKTSLFIIMSFVYAKLLVVVCVAYVISDVVTHSIPLWYYEGFFTYLYGMSILFLLYVFCFLLQESTCCDGEKKKMRKQEKEKPVKEKVDKKKEKEKKKKEDKEVAKKEKKEKDKKEKEKKKEAKGEKSTYRRNSEELVDAGLSGVPVPVEELSHQVPVVPVPQESSQAQQQQQQPPAPPQPQPPPSNHQVLVDVESGVQQSGKVAKRSRKTTQNDQMHGSFFLRIGAIAFGLGTMIYSGLEFGSFFEVPFTSSCYMILRGVNPVLQMIFTFMQMYFIFMNSRLNIHRFKVIARFGLMHVVATNICVWIRTVVLEYLKEITVYHKNMKPDLIYPESIKQHTLRNSNTVLGTHAVVPDSTFVTTTVAPSTTPQIFSTTIKSLFSTMATTAASTLEPFTTRATTPATTMRRVITKASTTPAMLWRSFRASPTPPPVFSTIASTTTASTTRFVPFTIRTSTPSTTTISTTTKLWSTLTSTAATSPIGDLFRFNKGFDRFETNIANVAEDTSNEVGKDLYNGTEMFNFFPQSLVSGGNETEFNNSILQASCGRVNIMGTIVQDASPYLFPFIIEYSLIGAAVIYVMWRHIGRNPRYYSEEDLEHRLEVMLSRRAVAMAHVQNGKVDCVGASKGLFFGLLLLVGSLICLILFFVLIHHRDLNLLAIYLADASHCFLMALSIIAIIVGFIRVQSLKFKVEEQSDLNDILLRISAFGLFIYATFSIIAGSLNMFTSEPNLLVMVTGILAVVQVVLQLLFIADVSRRRVHLPEHDRSKPGRQIVTFLLIVNITMWIIYTFEAQKVKENPIQLEFYGFLAWAIVQRLTLPLCIFHRFHAAVTLAEIWKTSYKAHLE